MRLLPGILLLLCSQCRSPPHAQPPVVTVQTAAAGSPESARTAAQRATKSGCIVDVYIVSWNIDFDGVLNEDEAMTEADPHDRIESCELADALRAWIEHAPPHAPPARGPDDDWNDDIRLVVEVTTPNQTDVLAVSFFCDWVRLNKTDLVDFDPSLFKLLFPALSDSAKSELKAAERYGGCVRWSELHP